MPSLLLLLPLSSVPRSMRRDAADASGVMCEVTCDDELRVTCYALRVTCYVLRVTCFVLRV